MTALEFVEQFADNEEYMEESHCSLTYSTNGWAESIDIHIFVQNIEVKINFWDSENEQRKYIEEINDYESFDSLFDRTIKEVRQYLNRM
jgi:hypothetical protein